VTGAAAALLVDLTVCHRGHEPSLGSLTHGASLAHRETRPLKRPIATTQPALPTASGTIGRSGELALQHVALDQVSV